MPMTARAAIERQYAVSVAGLMPAEANRRLAEFAKANLARAIADGSGSPRFIRVVNGRVGATEDTVQVGGPIVYEFDWLDDVVVYAREFLRRRSPVASGRYRDSFFALADGVRLVEGEPIPIVASSIVVTNDQPYSRKVEVGGMKMSVPPHIFEDARQSVQAQFGAIVKAEVDFILLPGGYRLRTSAKRQGRSIKGRRAGDPITYPALILRRGGAI